LQEDPSPGKLIAPATITNKYIYAINNPIDIKDPTGRSFLGTVWSLISDSFGSAISSVVGIVSSFTSNFVTALNSGQGFWKALGSGVLGATIAVAAIALATIAVVGLGPLGLLVAPLISVAAGFLNNSANQLIFHPHSFSFERALDAGLSAGLSDAEATLFSGGNPFIAAGAAGSLGYGCVDNGINDNVEKPTGICAVATFSF